MRLRSPLYAKILLWFFLNLVVLGAGFYLAFTLQFRAGLDSLMMGRVGDRIQAVSDIITAELRESPTAGWNAILERFSAAYRVRFLLFEADGTQAAGQPLQLPEEVKAKVAERRGRGGQFGMGPPPGRGPRWESHALTAEPQTRFLLHTQDPTRYWVGVCLPLTSPESARPWPLMLVAMSDTLRGGGLLIDLTPWIVVACGAVAFSALFWFPLVRGITRSVGQMTLATEQIAEGRFDARVETKRRDELGRLGQAINRMAVRLSGFVSGQKRFLGDIAHELCSPIARVQMALGILEQRGDEKQRCYVEDIREEVQHMSSLVNELLSFSKAGLRPEATELRPVPLRHLVQKAALREAGVPDRIDIQIPENLEALGDAELLGRAVANLLRNALRYAGDAAIVVTASSAGTEVLLSVIDSGPGVPEEMLQQIFDPFFRVEASRSRETGGVGLGLAIVKTCVEACRGTVSAHNRAPSGLRVDIRLGAVPAEGAAASA